MEWGNLFGNAGSGALAGSNFGPWGAAIGGGLGLLKGFFDSPEEPYKKAERPINRSYEEAKNFQLPYSQHGLDQYGRLNDATGMLLNPEELEAKWASGYTQSPYAQRMLDMNKQAGLEAASSMGLLGSSGALSNIQQGAGDIVAKDRQAYLNDLMQKYMQGIGLGENLYGTGASTAGNLGNQAIRQGENLAGLEYGRSRAPNEMLDRLMGEGATAAFDRFGNYSNKTTPAASTGGVNPGTALNNYMPSGKLFNAGNSFNFGGA